MRSVEPEVFLVAQPAIDYDQLAAYLREVGGEQWLERLDRGELPGTPSTVVDLRHYEEDAEWRVVRAGATSRCCPTATRTEAR